MDAQEMADIRRAFEEETKAIEVEKEKVSISLPHQRKVDCFLQKISNNMFRYASQNELLAASVSFPSKIAHFPRQNQEIEDINRPPLLQC
jgi:hypothetical protein